MRRSCWTSAWTAGTPAVGEIGDRRPASVGTRAGRSGASSSRTPPNIAPTSSTRRSASSTASGPSSRRLDLGVRRCVADQDGSSPSRRRRTAEPKRTSTRRRPSWSRGQALGMPAILRCTRPRAEGPRRRPSSRRARRARRSGSGPAVHAAGEPAVARAGGGGTCHAGSWGSLSYPASAMPRRSRHPLRRFPDDSSRQRGPTGERIHVRCVTLTTFRGTDRPASYARDSPSPSSGDPARVLKLDPLARRDHAGAISRSDSPVFKAFAGAVHGSRQT